MGITKAKDVLTGTEVKQLTPEQKRLQIENDKIVLESYEFQLDNTKTEITNLEEIIRLKLAEREIMDRLRVHKENLKRFENLIKILKQRLNSK